MWCANCNKTSYSDVCEVCGGKTQQDTPIELYRRRKFFVSGFTYLLRMTLRFCQTDKEKSSKSFSDLLLSLAADGRWIFSFESSGQVGPMMDSTINSCFPFKALCIFSISLDDYFFHNQSMYL